MKCPLLMPGEKGVIAVTFRAPGKYCILVFHGCGKFGCSICLTHFFFTNSDTKYIISLKQRYLK